MGDVHAIIVAGGQVAHAERLRDEFRTLLSDVRSFWGSAPLDEYKVRNLETVRHTLSRDSEFVVGDSILDTSHLSRADADDDTAIKFCTMFNGCWSSHTVQHFCHGCHAPGDEQEVEEMAAAEVVLPV